MPNDDSTSTLVVLPAPVCSFCSLNVEVYCGAPIRKTMITLPADLRAGDIFCSAPDQKEGLILTITTAVYGVAETVWILRVHSDAGEHLWNVQCGELPVLVKRLEVCGVGCCWKHYREVADGQYRCQDHWVIGTELSTEPEAQPGTKRYRDNRSAHKHWAKKRVSTSE